MERLIEHAAHDGAAFGRMCAFHGQMGMFTRALAYIMSHGADGLKQVADLYREADGLIDKLSEAGLAVYQADPEAYPLQKKAHSLEKLREWAHLRPRTNTFGAVARVRR